MKTKKLQRAVMAVLLASALLGQDAVPKHPRDLKYTERPYAPPSAAAFEHKLSSGAVAFLVEDHELPLISVSVTVRTGDYLDPAGKIGLAQFTGSQMRAGGTKSKTPSDFDEEAAFLAAQISSAIGDVNGQASLGCLAKDVDAGLALFFDMLHNPGFAEDRLKLAKSQMLQGMERRNDSTDGIEAREYRRLLRGERHFTSLHTTKPSVEAITRQDLVDFHARYYYPSNFIFAVSGDFKTPEMLAKLEKALASWPNRKEAVPAVPKPDHSPKPGVYVVNKKDVNQGRVSIGHLGVTITNPDHLALGLMNGILGGNDFSSRIVLRVRSEEGLAYSARSSFTAGTYYEGSFTVGFQSKSPSVAQAIGIVKEEIDSMRNSRVTAEELELAKSRSLGTLPLRFATAGAKARQFADDHFTGLAADYWEKYSARIRAVTPEEIQRVAQKYLHPDQLVVLVVGDVDTILKGNPDKPQFSLKAMAGAAGLTTIPLPDPLTMVYPGR